ncbi:MAG TPA: AmmeMemoRadiSam system protein B [Bryobacteraceae bacterium]
MNGRSYPDGSMWMRRPPRQPKKMLRPLRSVDFLPSPVPDRPGLLIRDPFRFSDAVLIVPPALVSCLQLFDGEHSELDLRAHLVQLTGELDVSGLAAHLTRTLSDAGFLEDEQFERRKLEAERNFAAAPERLAVHAGSGYPAEEEELRKTFAQYMNGSSLISPAENHHESRLAIVAPHVSPFGGVDAYRAAYSALTSADADRTFVILGTSHYGQPDRIGLTRKPFVTPLGAAAIETSIVDRLAAEAGEGALMEDYCHSIEHSIEFQVVFLQHLFGPGIRVAPILCGSFARSFLGGNPPEADEGVKCALGALAELAAREGDRLLWVLGVDMAHMGRRYGDSLSAHANQGEMELVALRDRARIERMERGDAQGFWELVSENRDDLRWCGSAPIYAFLRAVPQARGSLLHYQQWNIDPASVVSFAGMRFR